MNVERRQAAADPRPSQATFSVSVIGSGLSTTGVRGFKGQTEVLDILSSTRSARGEGRSMLCLKELVFILEHNFIVISK